MEIYEITPDGKKIIVDVLGAGDVFGDLGIQDATEYFVEATTGSFVCVVKKIQNNLRINCDCIKEGR